MQQVSCDEITAKVHQSCDEGAAGRLRVLVVASTKDGRFAPFVVEQVEAVRREGVEVEYFGIEGHGLAGYLRQWPRLMRTLRDRKPDVVHAHYGLCGVLACMQWRVPVVTTYHGSDINEPRVRWISRLAVWRSTVNVFVSDKLQMLVNGYKRGIVQPCGVDLDLFVRHDRAEARRTLGLEPEGRYVLFASTFDNREKDPDLAWGAVYYLEGVTLLEFKGYSREQVPLLLSAVDCLLLTSFTEGSPQVVKEAMACGTPVVSVVAGDTVTLLKEMDGCYLALRRAKHLAGALKLAIGYGHATRGRERLETLKLDNRDVARRIVGVYQDIVAKRKRQYRHTR